MNILVAKDRLIANICFGSLPKGNNITLVTLYVKNQSMN